MNRNNSFISSGYRLDIFKFKHLERERERERVEILDKYVRKGGG
jgi:hypothetical protein